MTEPHIKAPAVAPAPLVVGGTESVGQKYRHPKPSQAADEAERMTAAAGAVGTREHELLLSAIDHFRAENYRRARGVAAKLVRRYPDSPLAEAARWIEAEARFSRREYYRAWTAYEAFLKHFAGSSLSEKALLREFQCAEALLGGARRKILGLGLLSGDDEALAILEKIYGYRPTGLLAADAVFRIAEYHMDRGAFEEAEDWLGKFLKEFPNHGRARQAELWSAKCAMASNLGPKYDESTLTRARDTLRAYQRKYPKPAARENVAGALERIRHLRARKKYEMAAYYRRAQQPRAASFYARLVVEQFPGTPAAAEAQGLLQQLEGDE
jgi:outer membrane protein assembly factor BamD (BamD/ComL family)